MIYLLLKWNVFENEMVTQDRTINVQVGTWSSACVVVMLSLGVCMVIGEFILFVKGMQTNKKKSTLLSSII